MEAPHPRSNTHLGISGLKFSVRGAVRFEKTPLYLGGTSAGWCGATAHCESGILNLKIGEITWSHHHEELILRFGGLVQHRQGFGLRYLGGMYAIVRTDLIRVPVCPMTVPVV